MKALRFLGIALLACSMMFVSCKKDNPKPDNSTSQNETPGGNDNPGGGGETPGGGEVPICGVTIKLDGTAWNAANMVAVDHTNQSYIAPYFFKTENSTEDVYVRGFMESVVGEFTYQTTNDIMYYTDPNFTYTDETGEYGSAMGATDPQPGDVYSGWVSITDFTENITAVDLNALTMSATFSESLATAADIVAAGYQVPANLHTLEGILDGAHWTWASTKSSAPKKAVKGAMAINK